MFKYSAHVLNSLWKPNRNKIKMQTKLIGYVRSASSYINKKVPWYCRL